MIFILLILLLTAGCRAETPTPVTPTSESPAAINEPGPTQTPSPLPPVEPSPTATHTQLPPTDTAAPPTPAAEPALPPLPLDPQRIEFQAEDGAALVGYYYPAAVNPAPAVVLMHWAGGDQTDWLYVGMVSWLQNRGLEIPASPKPGFFDTPYPFPPLPEGRSYAVFTFDFRGFGESPSAGGGQPALVMDARAAYATAAALPGVDPARVVGIGASIGADGVVDGCNEACCAALSLGPGDWLEIAYSEAVTGMDELGKPAWCVGAEDDAPAALACRSAVGDHYQVQMYLSGGHAMRLFRVENNLQPPIESVIDDFLQAVFSASGESGGQSSTPQTASTGWEPQESATAHLSFSIPPAWACIDFDPNDKDASLAALLERLNDPMASMLLAPFLRPSAESWSAFLCYREPTVQSFLDFSGTSLSITRTMQQGVTPASMNPDQTDIAGCADPKTFVTDGFQVSGYPAVAALCDSGDSPDKQTYRVVVLVDEFFYHLEFSSTAVPALQPEFDAILETLQITP